MGKKKVNIKEPKGAALKRLKNECIFLILSYITLTHTHTHTHTHTNTHTQLHIGFFIGTVSHQVICNALNTSYTSAIGWLMVGDHVV